MTRLPFDQFLNSPGGPSTPRGRGGYRGGRGGGRGGTPGSGKSFKTDYSNVPFDYAAINKQQYTKMDGFNVMPYGSDSPRGRGRGGGGSYTPKVRGRGGLGSQHTPQESLGPSGSATPVHGLGYHGNAKGKAREDVPGASPFGAAKKSVRVESTVGRGIGTGDIVWGGRKGAPMFVKAGELFKDGEVDLITADEDKAIDVEAVPSVPDSQVEAKAQSSTIHSDLPPEQSSVSKEADPKAKTRLPPKHDQGEPTRTSGDVSPKIAIEEEEVQVYIDTQPEVVQDVSIQTAHIARLSEPSATETQAPVPVEQTVLPDEDAADLPELILDVDPQPVFPSSNTLYTSHLFAPIGGASDTLKPNSDEEEIIFKPRKYKQPQPISIDISSSSRPLPPFPIDDSQPIQAFIDPRAQKPVINRKDKKAAKREKKKGKGNTGGPGKRAQRRDDFGVEDDIEWGSDGPPKGLLRVEGLEEEFIGRGEDLDMAILRDYMEGTRLAAEDSDEDEMIVEKKGKGKEKEKKEELVKGREKKKRTVPGWNDPPTVPINSYLLATGTGDDDEEDDWEDDDGSNVEVGEEAEVEGEDEAGSEDSSELGDLDAIMDALDSDEDEEMDEDELFAGKNTWTSEDEGDWFIRSMEEALGAGPGVSFAGGKKGKNNLFSSVENGDFDMDLPTTPVKKGKKKAQGIPEALQAQWESDRQKKAFKKEQRQIERLILEMEGRPSSFRRKAKGTSKAQQASLAHLIPASAAEVADMFDVDSEDEGTRGMGKMRKMLNLPPQPGMGALGDLEGIVRNVREFVDDVGRTTFSLQPMEKEGRARMHLLAECFGLKSNSKGKGRARFTIFIKTSRTGLYIDEARIDRLISASSYSGGKFYKALYSKSGGAGGKGKDKGDKKKGTGDRGTSGRAREGELVGEGAERIGEGNMGHKLLSMMGWAEGGRIGKTDGGLTNPIVAVVKNTKSGLGA